MVLNCVTHHICIGLHSCHVMSFMLATSVDIEEAACKCEKYLIDINPYTNGIYTNADLKICLYIQIYIKIIP